MTAPVFVAGAHNSTSFAATSNALALNVGSAAGRCVLVLATNTSSNSTTPSSATYNGVSMTAGTLFTDSTGINNQIRLFWLFNVAATGSNNIVVTYSDGNGKPYVLAAAYSGVDTAAGVSGETTGHAFSTSPSIAITSAGGDLGVFLGALSTGTNADPAATAPAVTDAFDRSGTEHYDSFVFSKAGASSLTIAGTLGTPTPTWFGVAVSLKSASAGVLYSNLERNVGRGSFRGQF